MGAPQAAQSLAAAQFVLEATARIRAARVAVLDEAMERPSNAEDKSSDPASTALAQFDAAVANLLDWAPTEAARALVASRASHDRRILEDDMLGADCARFGLDLAHAAQVAMDSHAQAVARDPQALQSSLAMVEADLKTLCAECPGADVKPLITMARARLHGAALAAQLTRDPEGVVATLKGGGLADVLPPSEVRRLTAAAGRAITARLAKTRQTAAQSLEHARRASRKGHDWRTVVPEDQLIADWGASAEDLIRDLDEQAMRAAATEALSRLPPEDRDAVIAWAAPTGKRAKALWTETDQALRAAFAEDSRAYFDRHDTDLAKAFDDAFDGADGERLSVLAEVLLSEQRRLGAEAPRLLSRRRARQEVAKILGDPDSKGQGRGMVDRLRHVTRICAAHRAMLDAELRDAGLPLVLDLVLQSDFDPLAEHIAIDLVDRADLPTPDQDMAQAVTKALTGADHREWADVRSERFRRQAVHLAMGLAEKTGRPDSAVEDAIGILTGPQGGTSPSSSASEWTCFGHMNHEQAFVSRRTFGSTV